MNKKRIPGEDFLDKAFQKIVDNKYIFSTVVRVENSDGSFSWNRSSGDIQIDSRFFIASVTKLYVTAIVMRLIEENYFTLDDKISKFLPGYLCENIHVLNGVDHSDGITIRHLISNTSGLPDYFFHKQENGKTVADDLIQGNDESWSLEETIELIKKLKPRFKPGANGKASYSDTNYRLLGGIIENVTEKKIGEVFHEQIFSGLNLQDTYAYSDINDNSPAPFFYKSKKLWLPKYLASVTSEGGIVSTADEVMIFLKEFFNGRFFPKGKFDELKKWNLIFPPPGLFYFGIGLEKLWSPWIFSPFKPIGDILGFWGQTGSFAFYNPNSDLYFSGTTNQINGAGHRAVANFIFKIIKSVL